MYTMNQVQHLLSVQNELGEGPVWDTRRQLLYWVDIKQARLHRYNPASGDHHATALTSPIMALGFREAGGLVVACGRGLAFFDEDAGRFDPIANPEGDKSQVRFNDGSVDPAGRFWAGTMNESDIESPVHSLYRLDVDLSLDKVIDDVTIANGLGWSPDHATLYFTDTVRRTIFAYDYDTATGAIKNRRPFIEIPEVEGYPDGMTVDSEGCIWSAIWGGSKVARFDPQGRRIAEIPLPVAHVTSCAFGGKNFDTLYITTAWTGLDAQARRQQPQAGDVFCLQTDTPGLPEPRFKG